MFEYNYIKKMSEKSERYEALIAKAERERRDNGGKPSREEAVYYRDAKKVCEEIRDMNLSQRAEYNKWNNRAEECVDKVREIVSAINPGALKAPSAGNAAVIPETVSGREGTGATEKNGAVTATDSGFVTNNACRDVPAETIETWYKKQPDHGLADITGMDEAKAILQDKLDNLFLIKTKSALNYKEQKLLFFYGLPGCGKTYIIEAFINELMNQGYKFIKLKGGDIHSSLVGVGEKTVNIAFQEAIDNAPCVLFIDEFENVCVNRNSQNAASHEKRLTVAFLEARNMLLSTNKPVMLLGATNYPNLIDNAMMDSITPVRIPLPDENSRASYFRKQFEGITFSEELTFEHMAEATDNCSYRDLGKITTVLMDNILKKLKDDYAVYDSNGILDKVSTDNIMSDAVKEGKAQLTKEMFQSVISSYTPSDKTQNLRYLEEFEHNFAKAAEG